MLEKRDLFDEIMEGLDSMSLHRKGKITLRTHKIEHKELPEVNAQKVIETRKMLNLSRSIFANCLRISLRTLEKWEQGRSKPNKQASTLILLVRKYPDTLKRLAEL